VHSSGVEAISIAVGDEAEDVVRTLEDVGRSLKDVLLTLDKMILGLTLSLTYRARVGSFCDDLTNSL